MIRQKEYCDICETIHGEESPKALIVNPKERPAFAQLIWTYYKKGLSLFKNPMTEEPLLESQWLGQPNRLEFCDEHAGDFNTLLKYFAKRHYGLLEMLEEIKAEDDKAWTLREFDKSDEFKKLSRAWKIKNSSGSRAKKGGK